ncbi:MAG TPA: FAD-binding oxidoreductase [Acidimicrobiales bacterium]|nr:FAD-binding oxidoreductase [Acidimicrobiales bacterium]
MTSTDPLWWEDAGRPSSPPRQELPGEADVVVIGAGLTGLTAARTLARAGRSVVVLDRGAPGIGGSGCNGGMIGGGHLLSLDEMIGRYGTEGGISLIREAQMNSTDFARGLIAEEEIDCDLQPTGRFRGLWNRREYEETARHLERLEQHMAVEAEMVPPERQREDVATDLYAGGIIYHRHGALNPAKFVAGMVEVARRHGALVQGDTPVTAVQPAGSALSVETDRGTVRAGEVLAATNGYTPRALRFAYRRIVPVPSFIAATEELGEDRLRELIPRGRMITESRDRHCYYRPSPDGKRLVLGGRAAMAPVPERFATFELKRLIRQIFPQIGDFEITHSWTGRAGFSHDFVPHVGRHDGIWHAMGYSGNGNTMAPYLGHKAALQILGDPEGDTAFARTEFPTRWYDRGRPWFLPFADVLFRAKDVRSRLFRRR